MGAADHIGAHRTSALPSAKNLREIQPVDTKRSIPKRIGQEVKERGLTDCNIGLNEPKYRTIANIIFGGSRERMLEIAFGNQEIELGGDNSKVKCKPEIERWAMDIYRFACKEWGGQNVVSFVCHLDGLCGLAFCGLPQRSHTIRPILWWWRWQHRPISLGARPQGR